MKRSFPVHSTKYDGSLHYRFATTVVREEPGLLMLYGAPGEPVDCYRGQLTAKYHSLGVYWPDRFYNLEVVWYSDWRPRMHYVNIATPASWDDGALRFVDLDLDVVWEADSGEIMLDDQDEFELHQVRFGYPTTLIEQVRRSAEEVRDMMVRSTYPFDGSLFAWRPDGSPK
jgi:protein associated with RNAse G/E